MKKLYKHTVSLFIVAAFVLTTGFSQFAFAAPGPENSTATITFQENTDPTAPVDPEDPSKPGGGNGTEQPGPLSIDYISDFTFSGSHTVSKNEQTYSTDVKKPYLQVSDFRGNGEGWKVTANISSFHNGELNTLNGAYLILKNGSAISADSAAAAPTVSQDVILSSDKTDTLIVQAPKNTGMGTWVTRWFQPGDTNPLNDSVQLVVPAGKASAGTHSATITWTLVNAP